MNTKRITTEIAQAADAIRAGQLVAVPTETVYGLAGNGLDPDAVAQIYEVKGRPAVKPLSLMVHDASAMAHYCVDVPPAAYSLAEACWPGPLTIVLRAQACGPEIVRAGGETVGLRCPDHPATLALIEAAQLPLAAPSANPSGAPSPKTADDVLAYFDGQIAAVIDGGPCGSGRESTRVDLSRTPYRILRSAAVPDDAVWDALVQKMHIVGITGGTGCGKTTVGRTILRLYEPTAGEVIFDGTGAGGVAREDGPRLAYLGHATFVYPGLSALENLQFWARAHGLRPSRAELLALLEHVGLAAHAEERAGVFSRGMAQRLNLARVLLLDADLVLLDEPGTGLDVISMALVRREMLAARERGACVIVVSHDLAGDSPLADRLLLLENRRLAYDGPPQGRAAVDSVLNAATGDVAAPTAGEVPA